MARLGNAHKADAVVVTTILKSLLLYKVGVALYPKLSGSCAAA